MTTVEMYTWEMQIVGGKLSTAGATILNTDFENMDKEGLKKHALELIDFLNEQIDRANKAIEFID